LEKAVNAGTPVINGNSLAVLVILKKWRFSEKEDETT